jgi:hypothetical protein
MPTVAPPPQPTTAPTLFELVAGAVRDVAPLRLTLVLETAGLLALQALALGAWPAALALLGLAAVAGWGIADRAEAERRTGAAPTPGRVAVLRGAKHAAALIAGAAAFVLLLAATLWLSGPAPNL